MEYREQLFILVTTSLLIHDSFNCNLQNTTASCVNLNLTDIPDNLPWDITQLDLSLNNITDIKKSAFSRYPLLKVLILNKSGIKTINSEAFDGLGRLQNLSINGNHLNTENYTQHVFQPVLFLKKLDISNNIGYGGLDRKCNYSHDSFGVLTAVEELAIDLCEFSHFGKGFQNLRKLRKLDFDHCYARFLTNNTFENFKFSNITELSLSNCIHYTVRPDIDAGILSPFRNVKVLDLSSSYFSLNHSLKMLYPFRNKSLDVINLHQAWKPERATPSIQFFIIITRTMMRYLRTICVSTLILSYNGIADFESESLFTYDQPKCIVNLILSGNSFSIFYGYHYKDIYGFVLGASSLKLFDYSYIAITYKSQKSNIYSNTLRGENQQDKNHQPNSTLILPPKLETIKMSHLLINIQPKVAVVLNNTEHLKVIDWSYSTIGGDVPDFYIDRQWKLESFDISGLDSRKIVDRNFVRYLSNVRKLFMRNTNLDIITYLGKDIFQYFINTEYLDISHNHLDHLLSSSFEKMKSLEFLNVSSNSFSVLPHSLLKIKGLKTLDVRNNRLISLDKTITKWIDEQYRYNNNFTLFLDGNNFHCECEYQHFIEWLSVTKVSFDKDSYPCRKGGHLTNTKSMIAHFSEEYVQCSTPTWLHIGFVSLVSSLLLIAIIIVVYQYRWRLIYHVYRIMKKKVNNDSSIFDFEYDVFVAYASDSLEWLVQAFSPKLENEWNLNLCIKHRDYPVGASKADTIISCIQNSRNIVFIISRDFTKRNWGPFEIDMAKYEMFGKKRPGKIIIIIRNGVSKTDVLVEFSTIWKNIHLIEFEDNQNNENFWSELKLHLVN